MSATNELFFPRLMTRKEFAAMEYQIAHDSENDWYVLTPAGEMLNLETFNTEAEAEAYLSGYLAGRP